MSEKIEKWPPQPSNSYIPSPDSEFWDKKIETMGKEKREEIIILPKLKAQIKYVYKNSPFYRNKWDKAKIKPEDIRSLKDLECIPFVTKEEIRQDQKEFPPWGSNLCIPMKKLARIQGTSGTTGKPTVFGISKGDMQRIAEAHARIMWSFGVRPKDIVFIGSFFSLYWGSWGALLGAERLGAVAFPFGAGVPGQTERAIEWVKEIKPTVFYGTPSYALYFAEKAETMGINPSKDFNFHILFFSGEPGAGIPSTKKQIEKVYNGICIDSGSTSEVAPWMTNCECKDRHGMHLWQDIVYTELVDPITKKRVKDGEEGVLVYTHLERTSQPMIRFWSGDISKSTSDSCSCGRTYPRLPYGIYGRSDDMFIVRGENVYPSAVENVIKGIEGTGNEYRIIITREKAMDELIIKVEYNKDIDPKNVPALKEKLETEFKKCGLRSVVHMVPPNTFERTEFKSKRIIDKRELYEKLKMLK